MIELIDIANLLMQYGLAGIVILIFYKLMSNELKALKESIDELNKTIVKLIDEIQH